MGQGRALCYRTLSLKKSMQRGLGGGGIRGGDSASSPSSANTRPAPLLMPLLPLLLLPPLLLAPRCCMPSWRPCALPPPGTATDSLLPPAALADAGAGSTARSSRSSNRERRSMRRMAQLLLLPLPLSRPRPILEDPSSMTGTLRGELLLWVATQPLRRYPMWLRWGTGDVIVTPATSHGVLSASSDCSLTPVRQERKVGKGTGERRVSLEPNRRCVQCL
jgi:hypothetical protein